MIYYLIHLPAWVVFSFFIIAGMLLSLPGLIFVRRRYSGDIVKPNEVKAVSTAWNIIGALFALLLALVVVTVWQDHQEQNRRTVLEACELGNMYRDSMALSEGIQDTVKTLIKKYTSDLIVDAWPLLSAGEESKLAWQSFNRLYWAVLKYNPETAKEEIIYAKLIEHLNQLSSYRRLRLLSSDTSGIVPYILWSVMIFGAMISVGFSYLFKIENIKVHILISVLHSSMIAIIFFLISILNYPYRSSFKITPAPLEKLINDVFPMADKMSNEKQN